MSDKLIALQETAIQARAKADELTAALTDKSSDKELAAAEKAEKAAVNAENEYADAKAKADADAAAQSDAGAEQTPDASRTVFVSNARAGDQCICPDGRKGTVHKFDAGFVCIPNHEQGN